MARACRWAWALWARVEGGALRHTIARARGPWRRRRPWRVLRRVAGVKTPVPARDSASSSCCCGCADVLLVRVLEQRVRVLEQRNECVRSRSASSCACARDQRLLVRALAISVFLCVCSRSRLLVRALAINFFLCVRSLSFFFVRSAFDQRLVASSQRLLCARSAPSVIAFDQRLRSAPSISAAPAYACARSASPGVADQRRSPPEHGRHRSVGGAVVVARRSRCDVVSNGATGDSERRSYAVHCHRRDATNVSRLAARAQPRYAALAVRAQRPPALRRGV